MFQALLNTFSINGYNSTAINDHQLLNPLLLSYAIGGLALTWLFFIIYTNNYSIKGSLLPPLPPGPKPLPLLGNLLFLDPELHSHFANLSKSYGPILTLRLGRKVAIVITSPEMAKEVLKDQDSTFANRDATVAGLIACYGGTDIVASPNGPEWRMLRKVCAREMLCNATLDSVYALRRSEIQHAIRFLYGKAGKPVNVGELMFSTVLNVITNMLWGGTVKESDERTRLGSEEFRDVVGGLIECLGTPNISDYYPFLARFDLQGIRKKTRILAGKLDQIFERLIDQRLMKELDSKKQSKDFLEFLLIKLKDDDLTRTQVKGILMDMVVGGTETTSNAVEFALAEMMNKPEILRKVQEELEKVTGKNRGVEESDVQKLPYSYAVMKEALRLHPALPLMVPHCPSETTIVGGYTIPKGARVFVNVWAVHRDPSVWENASEFRPERFASADLDYSGKDFRYLPFGSGRRSCAGIAMGERMFMFSVASLVHSFDWEVAGRLDLEEKFGVVLKKKKDLIAIPIPRLGDESLYI